MECKFCKYEWEPRKDPKNVKACPRCKKRLDSPYHEKKDKKEN